MKRLLIAILLIAVIYVLGQMVLREANVYLNNASLALSGINKDQLQNTIRKHFNTRVLQNGVRVGEDAKFDIRLEYLNSDTEKDVIATVNSNATCGTGGCLTAFYIKNESGAFEPVNFVSAIKSLEVEPTITNGMHDIIVNGDTDNVLRWDGQRYSVNGY